MSADLGSSWAIGLVADLSQPGQFTLSISPPDALPSNEPPKIALYYDRGLQTFTGTVSGNSIAVRLDQTNFPRFLHGFTASQSMLMSVGSLPAFDVDLAGTSAAISALGRCTITEGFTQLPAPWHPAAISSGVEQAASGSGTTSPVALGTPSAPSAALSADASTSSQSLAAPAAAAQSDEDNSGADGSGGEVFAAAITGFILLVVALVARNAARNSQKARELALTEIRQQAHRLGIRRQQLLVPDFYGTIDPKRWNKEKVDFVDNRIIPLLARQGLQAQFRKMSDDVFTAIEQAAHSADVSPIAGSQPARDPRVFSPYMLPADYEMHCALLLRDAGWEANRIGMSGDQGTDVLARAHGLILVVQCKLYSSPVGNDAVQQVIAARTFQRANLAAVVSNQPYTPSARALAASSSVYLLHHSELAKFSPEQFASLTTK